jgi:S1-C subfamily serine protease
MRKLLIIILIICINSNIYSQPFDSQYQWEQYFENSTRELNPIEGIWFVKTNYKTTQTNREDFSSSYDNILAICFVGGKKYKTFHINKGVEIEKTNDIFFELTQNDNYIYKDVWIEDGEINHREFVELIDKTMNFISWNKTACRGGNCATTISKSDWSKIYSVKEKVKNMSKSGTGFAISSNGLIVTNYHVIDGANSIKIRGVKSDFYTSYNAKVLISDKNNDLALLQIDDKNFTNLGLVPYTIKTSIDGVGENIFVLGYPLRASMGDEIKLTNGIISSKTGFQGDVTSYQISAPVQPGNSGGPLFDNQGNLIGVVNSKHNGAENASYAIKTSYLTNLIDLLSTPPKLQKINSLASKTLINKVESIKKFVYIIETE